MSSYTLRDQVRYATIANKYHISSKGRARRYTRSDSQYTKIIAGIPAVTAGGTPALFILPLSNAVQILGRSLTLGQATSPCMFSLLVAWISGTLLLIRDH